MCVFLKKSSLLKQGRFVVDPAGFLDKLDQMICVQLGHLCSVVAILDKTRQLFRPFGGFQTKKLTGRSQTIILTRKLGNIQLLASPPLF